MTQTLLSLGALFAVTLVTSIIPGPSNFLTMRIGMRRGRRPALAAALGATLGGLTWCGRPPPIVARKSRSTAAQRD